MGSCTMVRMMRGNRGRGSRGFFPVQMMQPSQRLLPANSLQPAFYSNTRVCVFKCVYSMLVRILCTTPPIYISPYIETYFDGKQSGEEPLPAAAYVEVQATPPHSMPPTGTVVTQGQIVPNANKNRVQVYIIV